MSVPPARRTQLSAASTESTRLQHAKLRISGCGDRIAGSQLVGYHFGSEKLCSGVRRDSNAKGIGSSRVGGGLRRAELKFFFPFTTTLVEVRLNRDRCRWRADEVACLTPAVSLRLSTRSHELLMAWVRLEERGASRKRRLIAPRRCRAVNGQERGNARRDAPAVAVPPFPNRTTQQACGRELSCARLHLVFQPCPNT